MGVEWPSPLVKLFNGLVRRNAERQLEEVIRRAVERGMPVELSHEQAQVLVERIAQRELGMTAAEFTAAVNRGEIPDSAVAEHLAVLMGATRRPPAG